MSPHDDARLVQRVLQGDRSAYRALVERHEDVLFRRARAILGGDDDAARDVVQEAFVKAYERLGSCSRPDRFGGWVYRAVRNRCYDELRSPRRRAAMPLKAAGSLRSDADPEADLEQAALRRMIGDALTDLSPTLREAFVMKHVDGLSYDEMQDATGVARSALKMRVMRAREALEQQLRPLFDEAGGAEHVTRGGPRTSTGVEAAGPSRRGNP